MRIPSPRDTKDMARNTRKFHIVLWIKAASFVEIGDAVVWVFASTGERGDRVRAAAAGVAASMVRNRRLDLKQ